MKKHYLSLMGKSMTGFSLLEVLLSVTLLVVMAMGTAGALVSGTRSSVRNVERMQALMIAETKMAESRRAYSLTGVFPVGPVNLSAVQYDMPSATQLIVSCFEETGVACAWVNKVGMRRVEVQLNWTDRLGQNQTVNMVTYAYR